MGGFDLQERTRIGAMNRVWMVLLIINNLRTGFMESPVFRSDLLTSHELRSGGSAERRHYRRRKYAALRRGAATGQRFMGRN
jgi:hypothetical protein